MNVDLRAVGFRRRSQGDLNGRRGASVAWTHARDDHHQGAGPDVGMPIRTTPHVGDRRPGPIIWNTPTTTRCRHLQTKIMRPQKRNGPEWKSKSVTVLTGNADSDSQSIWSTLRGGAGLTADLTKTSSGEAVILPPCRWSSRCSWSRCLPWLTSLRRPARHHRRRLDGRLH